MNKRLKPSIWLQLGIAVCLWSVVFTPVVSAMDGKFDEAFYSSNDILFYNPEATTCSQSNLSSSAASLVGNTNAEKIWNWLKSQGLSNEQAAGVMGNITIESAHSFSPTIQQINSPWPKDGWGLAQWTSGRRTAIVSSLSKQADLAKYYDSAYGAVPPAANGGRSEGIPVDINIKLLDFELNYMMQESQGRTVSSSVASQGYGKAGASEWETLKKQVTIEDATVFWHNNFEVSDDTAAAVLSVRGGFAKTAFDSFSGGATAATPANGSSPAATNCPQSTTDSSNFNGGTLSETVKAYAWPDYKGKGFIQKMPAYQAAITKAKADGRYVGADGIDCGGFVTTLLVDSGFDPTYNSNGKGGATGSQLVWLQAHWDNLGKGSSINVANLKPGDVAISSGHTFVYVGQIDGFNSVIASSSQDSRAPMAGKESLTSSDITWFRKKG